VLHHFIQQGWWYTPMSLLEWYLISQINPMFNEIAKVNVSVISLEDVSVSL